MELRDKLLKILKRGEKNALHAEELESKLGLKSDKQNNAIRKLIRSCINDHNDLIGGTPKSGYWIINSVEEKKKVIKSLESRIEKTQKRIDNTKKAWKKRKAVTKK